MSADQTEIDLAAIAQAAIVRPGDTLVLRVADRVHRTQAFELHELIRERLPDVEVLLIGGVEEMVIHRSRPALEVDSEEFRNAVRTLIQRENARGDR